MNRSRIVIVGLVALFVSLIVTLWVYRELKSRLTPQVSESRQIVVAASSVPLGSRLTEQNIRTIPWQGESIPEGAFEDLDSVLDRSVIQAITKNEMILESKLARVGFGGVHAAIPEGMRALAVKVNDVVGVAGFAVPGTYVDVVLSGSPDGNQYEVSKTILENVKVLSAGQDVEIDRDGKPKSVQVITLLVSPEDAQRLALGSIDGQIRLALRNPADTEVADPPPVSKESLYRQQAQAEAPPRPPVRRAARPQPKAPQSPPTVQPKRVFEVEVIQGGRREFLTFEERKAASGAAAQPPGNQ